MKTNNERFFSVELKSTSDLKTLTVSNCTGSHDRVLVEGNIGELEQAIFIDCVLLEVAGKSGTLRIDLKPSELKREVSAHGTP